METTNGAGVAMKEATMKARAVLIGTKEGAKTAVANR